MTISNVTINGANNNSCNWAGITCLGDATIVLKGNNSVKGFYQDYPGIYVPYGKKLVIEGDGSLAASSNGRGAGIGGGYQIDCGVIDIKGGSITATGGDLAAGIGGGGSADCVGIFIRSGITSVIAIRGTGSAKPIGNGDGGSPCGPHVDSGLEDKTSDSGKARYITKGTVVDPGDLSGDGETLLKDGDIISGEVTGRRKISIADGATVTLDGVKINEGGYMLRGCAGLTCLGDATIILKGENVVNGMYPNSTSYFYPGIYVPAGKTLTIKGSGSLEATGNAWAAGIGGARDLPCGNIVIEDGEIYATGTSNAAGIGGGFEGACGDITIRGGIVVATGGKYGAGIGSGSYATCGNITITGGGVDAEGGGGAAGIGGGESGEIGSVVIGPGEVHLSATKGSDSADPIGKGSGGSCVGVTISSGLGSETWGATQDIFPVCRVTFDANGGTIASGDETKAVVSGKAVGTLPTATRSGYTFNGWFTAKSGGT